jgi:hypothetical protein
VAKSGVSNEHVVENVGTVPNVSYCERWERDCLWFFVFIALFGRFGFWFWFRRFGGCREEVSVVLEGEKVCKNLGWMPEIGESVDNWHGRVLDQFLDGLVVRRETARSDKNAHLDLYMGSDTSKDALAHATHHPRTVPDRLIHPHLPILPAQKNRPSTK